MLHILLVEDNPGDVLLTREGIRASTVDADVMIAYDGDQALRLLEHCDLDFAFVFLDLNIPKFNGFELLKRHHTRTGPPVVVLTSSENPEDRKRALELGASDYIVKPLGFYEFVDTVKNAVETWGGRAAARSSAGG